MVDVYAEVEIHPLRQGGYWRRCHARKRYTHERCGKPAVHGRDVCPTHGGLSPGWRSGASALGSGDRSKRVRRAWREALRWAEGQIRAELERSQDPVVTAARRAAGLAPVADVVIKARRPKTWWPGDPLPAPWAHLIPPGDMPRERMPRWQCRICRAAKSALRYDDVDAAIFECERCINAGRVIPRL